MKRNREISPSTLKLMMSLFSAEAFGKSYQSCFRMAPSGADLFATYLECSSNSRIQPNSWFAELAYRSKYQDVDSAIRKGEFRSGFEHWCKHGHAEGRDPVMPVLLPQHLPAALHRELEARFNQDSYKANVVFSFLIVRTPFFTFFLLALRKP